MLDDPVTAQYTHTLTVTGRLEGIYTCTVANSISTTSSARLSITGKDDWETLSPLFTLTHHFYLEICTNRPSSFSLSAPSPPTNVQVFQNGLYSLLVTWTPSEGPGVTGYTIYYQHKDEPESHSIDTDVTDTNTSISNLVVEDTYSIWIVAKSMLVPSVMTNAKFSTIGISSTQQPPQFAAFYH